MKGDTYKETIHDGSVSYSVTRIAPPPGEGKHTKTHRQILRRALCSRIAREMKCAGVRHAYAKARAFVYADVYAPQLRMKDQLNSIYGAMMTAAHRMTVKER